MANRRIGIAVDTETTDLLSPEAAPNAAQPFITELYMCKFDLDTGEIIEAIDSLVNIPIPVPDHIVRITGITDEMLERKPTFDTLIDDIIEFCDGVEFCLGQNLMFDLEVIRHSFIRFGRAAEMPTFSNRVCTVELSFPIAKRRMKLGDLYKLATSKELEGAHRARHDVAATIVVYKWLESEGFC